MTTRPERTPGDAALLDALAVRRQVAEFAEVADAQRSAIDEHVADMQRAATQAVGLVAEFERRLADLVDYCERLADRSERLGRFAVVRGGVRLEGTADGGVVVTVYEAATENAAVIRTVAFSPQEIMVSVSPPPRLRAEPPPRPEIEPTPPQVAPAEPGAQPTMKAAAPRPQAGVVAFECATPAAPNPGAFVRFLRRLTLGGRQS